MANRYDRALRRSKAADLMTIWSWISRLRGRMPPLFEVADRAALEERWTFERSQPRWTVNVIRAHAVLTGLRWRPSRKELIAPTPADRWTCYFIYIPDGQLTEAHRFTLAKLRKMPSRLMVVCAARDPSLIPEELHEADALLWKGLRGFDFSAYAFGLEALARRSPGANVLVLNDSVYGPFCDVTPMLDTAPWQLTGFTAFSMIENHVQSYAFYLRCIDKAVVRALRGAIPRYLVFDNYRDVVYCQEARFARVAARTMSVGAFWFADVRQAGDPSLYASLDLLENGFPFLKKSLFGRNQAIQPRNALLRALADRGHPLPISDGTDG
jgi:lipopolysaccharide biosynthesis protein